jgi:beta-glucuronidase
MKQSYRRDSIIKTIFFIHLLILVSGINSSAQAQSDARFQLQNIDSRQSDNLDGLWSIIVDPLENGYYNHRWFPKEDGYFKNKKMETPSDLIEYDFDTDELLMVPGDWNTQAEKLYYYEGTMWYKTEFEFTTSEEEQENYLHFGAINYEALIYLNGEKVGEHIGGYTSFSLNVTDFLNEGNNVLILKVDNKRKREGVPTINTDWWNYGGITRSVHLVSTPKKHIYDYFIQLNAEQKDIISGWVLMKNSERGDHVQLEIPELEIQTTVVVNDDGMGAFSFSASPDLWSPTNPKLYEVLLTIEQEVISDEIGFRTIETQGSKILLNGEAIFLKGISIHEEAPFKTGRVTSIEEVRVLLKWAKELGCNFVRLAHYPHSELMIREAEKLGLMVWSEIPVYWTVLFEHEETYQNAENQLKEMIARDKNRAGVVLWSIANETPLSEPRLTFLRKLAAIARSLDQTRLITAALDTQTRRAGENIIDDPLGEYVDVIGVNSYCGWYGGTPSSCKNLKWGSEYDKPVIFSEFGGGALQGLHGEDNERWTEEYQAAVYRNNIEMLKNIEFLAGTSPWILMDFRSHRRHLKRIQADFNRKGLISEQGVKKESFYIMQEYYNSIEY